MATKPVKKLRLSAKALVEFDSEYFDYLDPANQDENSKDFYKKSTRTRDKLLSHLATYVFDHDDNYGKLFKIKASFGTEVMYGVMVKLHKRDHDT
jgi:hypothetical protein